MINYKQHLIDRANNLGVYDIASVVIADPRFELWSGSSKEHQHHYGKGGLIQHTCEVVELCFANFNLLKSSTFCHIIDIDPIELYLSALFHDCGKMWDYDPHIEDTSDPRGHDTSYEVDYSRWHGNEHKRLIHHISRSAITWNQACAFHQFNYGKYADSVTHNILSHHGQREWGSPVMPKTKAAWLLHLCDGISARMNDADKCDFIKNF
jgi:3'-5' exoribonuclease